MSSSKATVPNKIGHQANEARQIMFNLESPMARQRKLLFSEDLSDVVFKVGSTGELIHAHKLIISTASEVFYAQFNGGFAEAKQNNRENPVIIKDIEPATFKQVLRYIYCGEVDINADNAIDIYYVSEKYMLTNLRDKGKLFLKSIIKEDNVLKIFNSNRQYKFDFVDEICLKIIRGNPLKCFRMKEFLTLSQPALELIAASRIMKCQKEQLCEAIEKWRKANNSTAAIVPKWEHMQCRKRHSFNNFHYIHNGNTDFTLNVDQNLHLHGLGVFIAKRPISPPIAALVKVAIEPFNVSVSKTVFTKKDLYIEEIVFEKITVTKQCRIKVTITPEQLNSPNTYFFCLGSFQPIELEGTKEPKATHNYSTRSSIGMIIHPNCVAYLLLDVGE